LRWGCPIRKSADQRVLAPPRGLSQRATSFIASQCQGIHQMPLRRLISLSLRNPRAGVKLPTGKSAPPICRTANQRSWFATGKLRRSLSGNARLSRRHFQNPSASSHPCRREPKGSPRSHKLFTMSKNADQAQRPDPNREASCRRSDRWWR
jgi:hypothetical protein